MAKVINLQGMGTYGTVFKVVPLLEVPEHCFQVDGVEGGKVTPQPLLPDISKYTVRNMTFYMRLHTHTCIHKYIHTYIHTRTHTHARTHARTHTHVHLYVHA